jgi:hypothetical protein
MGGVSKYIALVNASSKNKYMKQKPAKKYDNLFQVMLKNKYSAILT